MGLDIHAYRTFEPIEVHKHAAEDAKDFSEECYDEGHRKVFVVSPQFEDSLRGLKAEQWITIGDETAHFYASYTGFMILRHAICEAATSLTYDKDGFWALEPEQITALPFAELLNFADNEGWIGCEAAGDIADDFAEYHAKIVARLRENMGDPAHCEHYEQQLVALRSCFEAARNGGAVEYA